MRQRTILSLRLALCAPCAPDGTTVIDQVPLTFEDLLYPEEDDFVVQEPVHTRDFIYCHSTLEAFYAAEPSVVVLGDVG